MSRRRTLLQYDLADWARRYCALNGYPGRSIADIQELGAHGFLGPKLPRGADKPWPAYVRELDRALRELAVMGDRALEDSILVLRRYYIACELIERPTSDLLVAVCGVKNRYRLYQMRLLGEQALEVWIYSRGLARAS